MINNLSNILAQIQQLQDELRSKRVEGMSSGGEVRIVMNGSQDVLEVIVAPELMDPGKIEVFGELLAQALNDARERSRRVLKEEISRLTGLDLPSIPGLL